MTLKEEISAIKHAITLLQKSLASLEERLDIDSGLPAEVRFTPPGFEEARKYHEAKGYTFDAVTWYNHYQTNGWKVGKQKMKDWHASMVTWQRSHEQRKPQHTTQKLDAFGRPVTGTAQERLL